MDAKQTSGRKRRGFLCPFSERPTTRAREALFAMSSPASGHPRWDGPKAHRSRGEGGWAALRTRAALLLDRRPGHHTTTKTTPLMWWKGIMQGLRLTPAHPRQARGSRLGRLSSLPPSCRPNSDMVKLLHSTTLESRGDEGRRGELGCISSSADGVWFLAGDSSDRCWQVATSDGASNSRNGIMKKPQQWQNLPQQSRRKTRIATGALNSV